MNVKVEVGGMTRETRAVQERLEETVNRMVAEDITVVEEGTTSAMIEARMAKVAVKEEVIEATAMTGTTVVSEIIKMAATRMATRMATGTVLVDRMATARTGIVRMATRMAEETVHRMAGMIVEETNIPRPIPVNIAVLAQKETESAFRSGESSISFGLLFF